jgi:hypothetical protein
VREREREREREKERETGISKYMGKGDTHLCENASAEPLSREAASWMLAFGHLGSQGGALS